VWVRSNYIAEPLGGAKLFLVPCLRKLQRVHSLLPAPPELQLRLRGADTSQSPPHSGVSPFIFFSFRSGSSALPPSDQLSFRSSTNSAEQSGAQQPLLFRARLRLFLRKIIAWSATFHHSSPLGLTSIRSFRFLNDGDEFAAGYSYGSKSAGC